MTIKLFLLTTLLPQLVRGGYPLNAESVYSSIPYDLPKDDHAFMHQPLLQAEYGCSPFPFVDNTGNWSLGYLKNLEITHCQPGSNDGTPNYGQTYSRNFILNTATGVVSDWRADLKPGPDEQWGIMYMFYVPVTRPFNELKFGKPVDRLELTSARTHWFVYCFLWLSPDLKSVVYVSTERGRMKDLPATEDITVSTGLTDGSTKSETHILLAKTYMNNGQGPEQLYSNPSLKGLLKGKRWPLQRWEDKVFEEGRKAAEAQTFEEELSGSAELRCPMADVGDFKTLAAKAWEFEV